MEIFTPRPSSFLKKVIVVAPHPDDETLGCGGTLLRHKINGDEIHWIILTSVSKDIGYDESEITKKSHEIDKVAVAYRFDSVHRLNLPTTQLDMIPLGDIVHQIGTIFSILQPTDIYLPFIGDIHSDHRVTFDAVSSCTKWFRYNSIKKIMAYETLSETDFDINPNSNKFHPNVFVDISPYIQQKIEIAKLYVDEFKDFPFPRSTQTVLSLAKLRGSVAGVEAAEAFMLLRGIY